MLSRNNHYLSQMYLKNWSTDNKVEVYELLVPNSNYPIYNSKSIKGVGSYNSMYVRLSNNVEIDDIEHMFSTDYETPAKVSLDKAVQGEKLSYEDWYKLIDLIACHIVRSPKYIFQVLETGRKETPKILKTLKEEIGDLKVYKSPIEEPISFPINITKEEHEDYTDFKIETIIGKQVYLHTMNNMLKTIKERLHKENWSIITLDESVQVPTTDNPVVFLNYYDANNYNLNGNINTKDSNILFPISPNKIICCQIGKKTKRRITANKELSELLKKVIVENAYRIVISKDKDLEIPLIRDRVVDEQLFLEEKTSWSNFQKTYLEEESKYIKH